jgi:hypothetical protein
MDKFARESDFFAFADYYKPDHNEVNTLFLVSDENDNLIYESSTSEPPSTSVVSYNKRQHIPNILFEGRCNYDDKCNESDIRICESCGSQICSNHSVWCLCIACHKDRIPIGNYHCSFCNVVCSENDTVFSDSPYDMPLRGVWQQPLHSKPLFRKPFGCRSCYNKWVGNPIQSLLTPDADVLRSYNRLNTGCIVDPARYLREVGDSLLMLYDDILDIVKEYLCHEEYTVSCRTPYVFLVLRTHSNARGLVWPVRGCTLYD